MGLFSSKGSKGGEQIVAIFDVGSGSIGAAIATISTAKLPDIIWSKRVQLPTQTSLSYEQLVKSMLATLLDISLELQSNGVPLLKKAGKRAKLDDVFFAFASPWYSMQAKVFKIEKEESYELTEQFVKNLIKKEEAVFAEASKKASADKKQNQPPVLIERKVIQTSLNGYIVSDPYKKPVRHAQIDLVLSAVPAYIHDKASEIKNQLLNKRSGGIFHSFILPAFIVTRDIFHGNTSFLQIDISGEVTDVATVHKGTIVDATSFPYGKNYVIREIAKKFNISVEQSLGMLHTYMAGESTADETTRIRTALVDVHKVWLDAFYETVARISTEVPLPKNIYVTVDDDFGEWFKQTILAGDFSEYALSKTPFRITHLSTKLLSNYVTHSKLTAELDPFLALEAIFLRKALYE